MKTIIALLIIYLFTFSAFSQSTSKDSLREELKSEKPFLKTITAPKILIASSLIITGTKFENGFQRDVRQAVGEDFYTSIDDHLWRVPLAQMYTADLLGVSSKNHWFDQTKNAFIAHTINKYTTNALKGLIGKERPSKYNNASFPSGHTSKAFTSATVLYEEFKDSNPWLAYSGFAIASTTGFLRIAKNAHYLSDVLAGAGLGILITKLVYHFDYLFDWNPFLKEKEDKNNFSFNLTPTYQEGSVGLSVGLKF